MSAITVSIENTARHAGQLLDLLVDAGPLTSRQCCEKLEWSQGRFSAAVRYAREQLCPGLGIAIPAPTPTNGWLYQATTDWQPVEDGAAHTLGLVESRLVAISRDVELVLPHLERGTKEWRRANFLNKHLTHLTSTLKEINTDG